MTPAEELADVLATLLPHAHVRLLDLISMSTRHTFTPSAEADGLPSPNVWELSRVYVRAKQLLMEAGYKPDVQSGALTVWCKDDDDHHVD